MESSNFPMADDLSSLKDDMIAFTEGHGMRRFQGYASPDEVQCVMWQREDNPDGWKDFVELAKHSGAPFLTMHTWMLDTDDLEELSERLRNANYSNDEDIEEARWLKAHLGKTGFIQLGWPYQGTIFLYEASTEWYERYQNLVEISEDFSNITFDGPEEDAN